MKSFLLALAALPLAFGHTSVANFYVNGVDQGDAMCLRIPADEDNLNAPVEDLASDQMACGAKGDAPVPRACPVTDGAALTFKYLMDTDNPSEGVLDPSHSGSCAVWLKKVNNALQDPGFGDGWFKIWDLGADANNRWCTNKLIDSGGLMTVNLPKGLLGGYYLVRTELLALHNANKGDPQYYVNCAQIYLQSSGTLVPQATINIPNEYVNKQDTADSWNLYGNGAAQNAHNFVPPGPAPATLTSGTSNSNNAPMPDGGRPAGCVLEAGNYWCGIEEAQYYDFNGCNADVADCWKQNDACYQANKGYTGRTCAIWQAKCQNIEAQCNAKNFPGPSDIRKDLTPSKGSIQVPQPLASTRGASLGPMYSAVPGKAPASSASSFAPVMLPTTTYAPLPAPMTTTAYPQPAMSTTTFQPLHIANPSAISTATTAPGYSRPAPKPTTTSRPHWFSWPPWWHHERHNLRANMVSTTASGGASNIVPVLWTA